MCCVCVCTYTGAHTLRPQKDTPRVRFEKSLLGGMGRSVCWLQELRWAWEVGVGILRGRGGLGEGGGHRPRAGLWDPHSQSC